MKIGFAFLCKNNIFNQDLWNNFFNSLNVDYEIFIHSKKEITTSFKKSKENKLDPIPTKWADISLVHASNLLFEASFNNSCEVTYLLSGDSIPTRRSSSFCSTNTSTTLMTPREFSKQKKYKLGQYWKLPHSTRKLITKSQLKKQHMFFCMRRSDFFGIKYLEKKGILFMDDFSKTFAPDEWFWINALKITEASFINRGDYLFTGCKLKCRTKAERIKTSDIFSGRVNNFIFARKALELSRLEKLELQI